MPTTCEVEFDNNLEKVFYAGQLLRGTALITLTKRKKLCDAYIQVSGKVTANWDDGCILGYDDHYFFRQYLWEWGNFFVLISFSLHWKNCLLIDWTDEIDLMPGKHRYPFEYMLPDNLSSSNYGTYGHIQYKVCVWLQFDNSETLTEKFKRFKFPFTVIKVTDLNLIPSLRVIYSNFFSFKFNLILFPFFYKIYLIC